MLLFCLKEGRLGLSCGIVGVVQTCVLELLRNRFRSLSPCAWTPFLFVKSHCASYFFVLSRWVLPLHFTSLPPHSLTLCCSLSPLLVFCFSFLFPCLLFDTCICLVLNTLHNLQQRMKSRSLVLPNKCVRDGGCGGPMLVGMRQPTQTLLEYFQSLKDLKDITYGGCTRV